MKIYVVVSREGKVRKRRRHIRVWTTLKGAQAFIRAGDSVVELDPLAHEPVFIKGQVL